MENEKISPLSLLKLKREVMIIYLLGIILWVFVWYLIDGFYLSGETKLLWFPFIACIFILITNLFLWKNLEDVHDCDQYENELNKLQYVERNAAHLVTAITGLLLIAAAISDLKGNASIPKSSTMFESIAFICAVVGVLPKYWIPSKKSTWLIMLRHLKTLPYTYSVALFLGGLITLLDWL